MGSIIAVKVNDIKNSHILATNLLNETPYRSPDGILVNDLDDIALGIGFMRILPEDPLAPTIFNDDRFYITSDARIDNREELLDILDEKDNNISDGFLILKAYREWGKSVVNHLRGDFSFIIYDRKNKSTFACRDHMGVRPLFYRKQGNDFLIASEFKILANPGAPFADLKPEKYLYNQLADFLVSREHQENEMLYEGIWRIPAGNFLYIDGNGNLELECYWQPTISEPGKIKDLSPKALREIFLDAVKVRMRSIKPVASLLSGGLDSTSIACAASQIAEKENLPPIDTFSVVFDEAEDKNERPYVEAAIKHSRFNPRIMPMDNYSPINGMQELLELNGRPYNAPGLIMTQLMHKRVGSERFRVLLDGHGGDEVISHGFGRIAELAYNGQWKKIWKELGAASELYGDNRIGIFISHLILYGRFKGSYKLRAILPHIYKLFVKPYINYLGPKLTQYSNFKSTSYPAFEAPKQEAFLRSAHTTHVLESLENTAAGEGLTLRFPFFDIRIVEFCLALPSEAKLDKGWLRLILREAMEGILPEEVRWRKSKFDFGPEIAKGMVKNNLQTIDKLFSENPNNLRDYFDIDGIKSNWEKCKKDPNSIQAGVVGQIWRSAVLAYWLGYLNNNTHDKDI